MQHGRRGKRIFKQEQGMIDWLNFQQWQAYLFELHYFNYVTLWTEKQFIVLDETKLMQK